MTNVWCPYRALDQPSPMPSCGGPRSKSHAHLTHNPTFQTILSRGTQTSSEDTWYTPQSGAAAALIAPRLSPGRRRPNGRSCRARQPGRLCDRRDRRTGKLQSAPPRSSAVVRNTLETASATQTAGNEFSRPKQGPRTSPCPDERGRQADGATDARVRRRRRSYSRTRAG
jgi:hypothetical protein